MDITSGALEEVSLRKLCDPRAMLLPENLVADAFRHLYQCSIREGVKKNEFIWDFVPNYG